jgi:hypothetical protein
MRSSRTPLIARRAALVVATAAGCGETLYEMQAPRRGASGHAQPLTGPAGVYRFEEGVVPSVRGLGLFAITASLDDLDGDDRPDLVISSGANESPQPLVMYANTGRATPFRTYPSWFSDTFEHRGAHAIGDIDGNGWNDLVVPVLFGRGRDSATGRFKDGGTIEVFLNEGGHLPGRPSYTLSLPDTPLSAALADVDADGDLDLAVASVGRGPANQPQATTQHIYFNREGRLRLEDPANGPVLAVVSLVFADLDQDGWIDLVTGGDRVNVFRGGRGAFSSGMPTPIGIGPRFQAAYGLAIGQISAHDSGLAVFVADNCRLLHNCPPTNLWYFKTEHGVIDRGGVIIRALDSGSHIQIVDGNNDQLNDLIVTQLGQQERGAPMLVMEGTGTGSWTTFETRPIGGEAIAVADVVSKNRMERSFRVENRSNSIVTLPVSHVELVRSVAVDGKELARNQFTWVPGTNWIALANPDDRSHVVEIRTVWSPFKSLVVASHDPTIGFHMVVSHYQSR